MASIQVGAAFAKGLFSQIGPLGATSLRLAFASVILLLLWRPWRRKWKKHQLVTLALYGVSLGMMNLLFYLALERTPLGIAVALEFVGPLAIALFSSRRRLDIIWAILATCGVFLVLPSYSEGVQNISLQGSALRWVQEFAGLSISFSGKRWGTMCRVDKPLQSGCFLQRSSWCLSEFSCKVLNSSRWI